MSSPFDRLLGVTQGRIRPTGVVPGLGEFVWCLGSDVPGDTHWLAAGDRVSLSQTADVTGLVLVRFRFQVRPPEAMPSSYLNTVNGAVVQGSPRWVFSWGVDAVVHGRREVPHGRRLDVRDGAIDVGSLMGNQELRFTLQLVYP